MQGRKGATPWREMNWSDDGVAHSSMHSWYPIYPDFLSTSLAISSDPIKNEAVFSAQKKSI